MGGEVADNINVSATFDGVDELETRLTQLIAEVGIATTLAVVKAAQVVKKNTQTGLALRSHKKGTWSPSPPGDAPALVTGALRRSIKVYSTKSGDEVTAKVGPTIIYGRIQELGGDTGRGGATHLPPRPYLRPALEYSYPEILVIYTDAWAQVMTLNGGL